MCASTTTTAENVLLYDVSRDAYEALLDALGDQRTPHTYQDGTLELFKTVYPEVSWEDYENVLNAFDDRRFPHTYQDGTLEIMMSPSEDHEQIKSFLGRLIEVSCLELGVHFKAVGSAMQRRKARRQGLEPDESFYVPYSPKKIGGNAGESGAKRMPDLAIEVDLRKVGVPRMKSYAKLGIREVWRYHNRRVEFYRLAGVGRYARVSRSRIFPMIGSKDVTRFLNEMRDTDDYIATLSFLAWLREETTKRPRTSRKKET